MHFYNNINLNIVCYFYQLCAELCGVLENGLVCILLERHTIHESGNFVRSTAEAYSRFLYLLPLKGTVNTFCLSPLYFCLHFLVVYM